MLILNMFIYKLFYEKKRKKNLQDIILVQMYEIVKIQMHFQSNFLIFLSNSFIDMWILEKYLRKKLISFHLNKV